MPLLADLHTDVQVPVQSGRKRASLVHCTVSFSSGTATVVTKSHPEITVTRQSTTGIYDVTLPTASAYHLLQPVAQVTDDDNTGDSYAATWGVVNAAAGTAEVRFLDDIGADVAPQNDHVAHLTLIAFQD